MLRADAGAIRWRGPPAADLPRRTWGYLPEERGLYPRMAVLDQLVFFAALYGESPDARAARGPATGSSASASPTRRPAGRGALARATSRRSSSSPRSSTTPTVLLMDEPFTGLDPVNLVILREAFLELRDRGRTLIFSTHQMEAAEALCESVAIVDRGRVVVGGAVARREAGERPADGPDRARRRGRPPAWLGAAARASRPSDRAPGTSSSRSRRASSRRRSSRPSSAGRGGRPVRDRRPVARGDLHRAGRPPGRRRRVAPGVRARGPDRRRPAERPDGPPRPAPAERRRSSPRREYRDRVRSPFFVASTSCCWRRARSWRWRRSASATWTAGRSPDRGRRRRRRARPRGPSRVADSILNTRPTASTRPPGRSRSGSSSSRTGRRRRRRWPTATSAACCSCQRLPDGGLDVAFRTNERARRRPRAS